MLKKEFRLSRRNDIALVKERGRMAHSPTVGLLVLKKEGKSKFGWIVSKRVSKKAVERNRIKRMLSLLVAKHWSEIGDKGIWGLFLARSNMVGKRLPELVKETEELFKKIR